MTSPPKQTLLAGVGNPLSGDDGFGPRVIAALRADGIPPGVEAVDAGTDLLHHLESFARFDQVILADAILDPEGKLGPPGDVKVVEEETFSAWPESSQGVHQMSPMLAVKLFRVLYPQAETRIRIVGLFVDRVTQAPLYLTPERVREALRQIRSLL